MPFDITKPTRTTGEARKALKDAQDEAQAMAQQQQAALRRGFVHTPAFEPERPPRRMGEDPIPQVGGGVMSTVPTKDSEENIRRKAQQGRVITNADL